MPFTVFSGTAALGSALFGSVAATPVSSAAAASPSASASASASTGSSNENTTTATSAAFLAVAIALPFAIWLWFSSGSSGSSGRPRSATSASGTRRVVPGEFPGSSGPSSPPKAETNARKKKRNKKKNKKTEAPVEPISTVPGKEADVDSVSDDIELVSVPSTPSAPGPRQKPSASSSKYTHTVNPPAVLSHDSESALDSNSENDWVAVASSASTGAQAAQRVRRRNKHYAPVSEHEQWARLARPDPKRGMPGFAALATTTACSDDHDGDTGSTESDSDADADTQPKPVAVAAPKPGQPRVLTLVGSTPPPPPVYYKSEPASQGLTKSQRKHQKNREKQRQAREAERKVQEQRHFNYRMEQMRAQDLAAKEKKLGKPRVVKATDGGVWKTGKGNTVLPVPEGTDKVAEAFLWGAGSAASSSSAGDMGTGGSSSSVVDSGVHHVSPTTSPWAPPPKKVGAKQPAAAPAWAVRGSRSKVDPYHMYHPTPSAKDEKVAEDFHEQPISTSSSSSSSSSSASSSKAVSRSGTPPNVADRVPDLVAQQLLWGSVAAELRENQAEEVEGGTWMQPQGKRRQGRK